MRKIVYLVVACILALVFVSVSNVSALGKNKILYTEWLISPKITAFDPTGAYDGGGGGGDGIVYIDDFDVYVAYAFLVESGGAGTGSAVPGSTIYIDLYDYTYNASKSILKSTDCYFIALDPFGDPFEEYSGPCEAKITFSSAKAFTGTITITDIDGSQIVITFKGKRLGQYR